MTDDLEWKKLSTIDKIEHKQWKARVEGYEEAIKLFQTQTSEKSNLFGDYISLLKKLVSDSNAVAQEKALDAVLAFMENASIATRVASEVCSAVVSKCLNSARTKTKEKGIEILLYYVELEKADVVIEEVLKGLNAKQPKVVVGCVQSLKVALSMFGSKVISIKSMLKPIISLLEVRDPSIRTESKDVIIEMYRWAGPAIKPQLSGLKPIQLTELEAEFAKIPAKKPVPTRYLKSEKPIEAPHDSNTNAAVCGDDDSGNTDAENDAGVDAYELAEPVDVLSKLPSDFWENIEAKKWQDRKAALEAVEKLSDTIRITPGDFNELIKSLLKVIAKDTNVLLVGLSAKCVAQIAKGLRQKFQSHAVSTIQVCIEKFKERKPAVLVAVRAAADAAQNYTSLDALQEIIIEALSNKNPGIRAETALFLGRTFSTMNLTSLNRKLLKLYVVPLMRSSADTVLEVREASFTALGTAMFVVTEKNINPFLADMDNIRMGRVKEFYEKIVNEKKATNKNADSFGGGGSSAAAPNRPQFKIVKGKRPVNAEISNDDAVSAAPPKSNRPGTSKPVRKKAPGVSASATSDKMGPAGLPKEQAMSADDVLSKSIDIFGDDIVTQLTVINWKERLTSMETLAQKFRQTTPSECSAQLICCLLMRKPGLKDNNFQVLRLKFDLIAEALLARKPCSEMLTELLLPEFLEKVGDIKVGDSVKLALTALSEATSFDLIGDRVLNLAFQQKNPKAHIEGLNWLSLAIKEFGLNINTREVVASLKVGFAATNLQVRQACIFLSSVVYLYMGNTLRVMLQDEKPAMIALLEEEWAKLGDSKPPAPTRGLRAVKTNLPTSSAGAGGSNEQIEEEENEVAAKDLDDLVPRTDITNKLTDAMLNQLTSKAWKERQESLNQIEQVLKENPYIEGGSKMHDSLAVIAKVCLDVNKIIAKNVLGILTTFAAAFSKAETKKLVKFIEPMVLSCFGDSKPLVREAASNCLQAWLERTGFVPLAEGDMFADALKVENPFLRTDLLGWLATAMIDFRKGKPPIATLGTESRESLISAVLPVLEERNGEARARAHKMLPILIRSFGPELVVKCVKRLKSSSMDSVQPHVEKARELVAAEDAAAAAAVSHPPNAPTSDRPKTVRGGGASQKPTPEATPSPTTETPQDDDDPSSAGTTSAPTVRGRKTIIGKKVPAMTAKKAAALEQAEEAAAMVPLQVNKLRETRMQDEKKRKLLKWDFDAPTKDHVQQLNQLFLAANVSSDLHVCLFHSDFKQHIKAIDVLSRVLDGAWSCIDGEKATRANLDLILRWMVLRFFDTSPAVLLKGLEYVLKVFTRMSETETALSEYEGSAFLPYLVNKVGDPKDNIRRDIRAIFKIVVSIYPPPKFYTYLIGGLKSKVNKARQECLEELGCMIDQFGLNVCQPSPAASLRVLATQIADRDSGVRTAALNSLVAAYTIVGEPLWKMLGDLSEKDRSMLEERIKRSGRPVTASSQSSSKRSASERPSTRGRETIARPTNGYAPPMPQQVLQQSGYQPQSVHSIAYAKAQNMLGELGDLRPEAVSELPNLLEMDQDINDIFKPILIPELKPRDKQPVLNVLLRTSPDAASAITMVVTQISSNDLNICCYALGQIDTLLQSDKWQLLMGHVNQIIMLITIQLRQTKNRFFDDRSISPSHLVSVLRCLLVTTDSIFKRPQLARETSRESLKEFLFAALNLMVHDKTSELPEGGGVVRIINAITRRIIEESNSTRVLSAFIRLLHESVSSGHFNNRFTQVVMRSLWTITKAIKTNANNYALETILTDCHNFLKAFPSPSWKTRKSDTPLRTIKTMLHSFCQIRGPSILKFIDYIPNKEDSELETYLIRTLKTLANTSNKKLPPVLQPEFTKAASPIKTAVLTVETREKLANLFQRILSSKDEKNIEELYDLTIAYPDLDLEPFLANSSPFFQTYVRQALYNIGLLRRRRAIKNEISSDDLQVRSVNLTPRVKQNQSESRNLFKNLRRGFGLMTSNNGNNADALVASDFLQKPANPKFIMDRLVSLRQDLGLESKRGALPLSGDDPNFSAEGRPSGGAMFESTLRGIIQPPNGEDKNNPDLESTPETKPQGGGMSNNEIMEIRRRLDLIKNAQSRG